MESMTRIKLHLCGCVVLGRRREFIALLREAIPFYESPGGIKVRLLEHEQDDHRFIELVMYDDESVYRRDQERVANDPMMKAYLTRWRERLAEPPAVEVYRLVAS